MKFVEPVEPVPEGKSGWCVDYCDKLQHAQIRSPETRHLPRPEGCTRVELDGPPSGDAKWNFQSKSFELDVARLARRCLAKVRADREKAALIDDIDEARLAEHSPAVANELLRMKIEAMQ